jgi:hypothetical protein
MCLDVLAIARSNAFAPQLGVFAVPAHVLVSGLDIQSFFDDHVQQRAH